MWKVWDFLLHFTYFTWLFISISTRRFITSCMWQAGQLLHCDNWSVCCRLTRSATPCSACSPTWRRGTRSSGGPDPLRMRTWATPPPAAVSAPEARDTPHISDGIHHWWMMVSANVISYFTYPMLWKHQSVIWFILHMYLLKCYTMESSIITSYIYLTYHVSIIQVSNVIFILFVTLYF